MAPYFHVSVDRDKNFKENQEGKITMADQIPSVVAEYISWSYSKKGWIIDRPSDKPAWAQLAAMWKFGDYVDDSEFCDVAMAQILQTADVQQPEPTVPTITTISHTYNNSAPRSALRRVFAAIYAENTSSDFLDQQLQRLDTPSDFTVDVAAALKQWMEEREAEENVTLRSFRSRANMYMRVRDI